MALNLFFVRHGQTDWNVEKRVQGQSESSLTQVGRQQAENLRSRIEALGIDCVYSSPSKRTQQTTALLTVNLDLPVILLPGLREIYMASWETRLWSEVAESEPEEAHHFRYSPEQFAAAGAETFAEMQSRGLRAVREIVRHSHVSEDKHLANDPNAEPVLVRQILVVSHGAFIKTLLAAVAGVPLSRLREMPNLENCSVSKVTYESGKSSLVSVADVALEDTPWAQI